MSEDLGVIQRFKYNEPLKLKKDPNIFKLSTPLELIEDRSNIILSAQTRGGKTTLLHTMLNNYILHDVNPHNIVIFSKTARDLDISYVPLVRYLTENTPYNMPLKIYDSIDMSVLDAIVMKQKELQKVSVYTSIFDNTEMVPLEKYIVIFDDIIGDSELKHYNSELCNYCTRSRHANILNIFLTQDWVALPPKIRRNANLVFLLSMDTYADSMIEENSTRKTKKWLEEFFETQINEKKNHSFIIVD